MNKVNAHSLYQRKNHWYKYQLDSTYIKYTAKKQEYNVYDKQENVLVICNSHNQSCNNSRNLLQRDDVREQHGSSAKKSQCSCVGSGFLNDTPKLFPSQCFVNQCRNDQCVCRSNSTSLCRSTDTGINSAKKNYNCKQCRKSLQCSFQELSLAHDHTSRIISLMRNKRNVNHKKNGK